MRFRVLGCGDAFGSGGRLNTCFFIEANIGILLDCGASALSAMKRHGLDGNQVDVIVLTHLHGDHFAGIPFGTDEPLELGPLSVRAMAVQHTAGTNPHAVRLTIEGRTVVYSGDTAWLDSLVEFAAAADLFLCECYQLEPRKPNHIDLQSLRAHVADMTCRRLVLTHMGDEILALPNGPDIPERAFDGMEIPLDRDPR